MFLRKQSHSLVAFASPRQRRRRPEEQSQPAERNQVHDKPSHEQLQAMRIIGKGASPQSQKFSANQSKSSRKKVTRRRKVQRLRMEDYLPWAHTPADGRFLPRSPSVHST